MSQMTLMRIIGLPEDVAGAIFLLAFEQARFITGAYLLASGGIQII